MLNARSITLSYDDFLVWRGIEKRCFLDFCRYLSSVVLIVKDLRVHDCSLSQLKGEKTTGKRDGGA